MPTASWNSLITPTHLAVAYSVLFVFFLVAGRAQRREVGASIRRLWLVSAAFAALALVPTIPALLLGEQLDTSWAQSHYIVTQEELDAAGMKEPVEVVDLDGERYYRVPYPKDDSDEGPDNKLLSAAELEATGRSLDFEVEDVDGWRFYRVPFRDPDMLFGIGYLGWPLPVNLFVLLLALVTTFRSLLSGIRPVRRALKEHSPLPLVDDPEILARVSDICERMGTVRPRVLSLPTVAESPGLQAVTGGMLAPVIIATDGVLGRLQDDETAAILAHEMGHVVRRSVLRALLYFILISTLAVAISGFLFPAISIALLVALQQGWKIFSHVDELASDRLAAQAVGFDAEVRALDKVHASNALPCGPWLKRVFHATQTHPAGVIRHENLARHAPEPLETIPDAHEVCLQRRTNRIVLSVFLAVLAFGVWAGFDEGLKWYGVGLLSATVLLPLLSVFIAVAKRLLYARQLGYVSLPWGKVCRFFLYIGGLIATVGGLGEPWAWPSWLALVICVTTFVVIRRRTRQAVKIMEAMAVQDFNQVHRILNALPRRRQNKPFNQVLRANLFAVERRDDEAMAVLDTLARERPRFWPGRLLQTQIMSWREPEKALEIAREIDRAVPDNPFSLSFVAACLARLKRFEEAESVVQQVLELDAEDGDLHVLSAVVASRAGDVGCAEERLREAEKRHPTSTRIFLVRARVHLIKGELDAAREVLAAAEVAVEEAQLSLLMFDLEELQQRFREAEGARRRSS